MWLMLNFQVKGLVALIMNMKAFWCVQKRLWLLTFEFVRQFSPQSCKYRTMVKMLKLLMQPESYHIGSGARFCLLTYMFNKSISTNEVSNERLWYLLIILVKKIWESEKQDSSDNCMWFNSCCIEHICW